MKKCVSVIVLILLIAASLAACGGKSDERELSEQQIESLSEQLANKNFDSQDDTLDYLDVKPLDSIKVYGTREKDGYTEVYIWDLSGNYVKYKGTAYEISGSSMPARLTTKIDGKTIKLVDVKYPEDGDRYAPSIEEMFPKNYAKKAISEGNNIYETLKKQQEKKIKAVWNVKVSEDLFDLNLDTGEVTVTKAIDAEKSDSGEFEAEVIEKGHLSKRSRK